MGDLQVAERVANKLLLGNSGTMGHCLTNRSQLGSFLSNAEVKMLKVIMLRFSS